MDITFLEAPGIPLTKSYELAADGSIAKTPYPHVYEVTSHHTKVADMLAFAAALKAHASKGHCLLKGNTSRPLVKESRAGSTDANAVTEWICFDVDGLPQSTPDTFLAALGLHDVSYVLQYSGSHGMGSPDLRCHIFMQLDKPYAAPLIKQWLIDLNLSIAMLSSALALTKTGNAIRWALDISACQNDKLIYIAPPKIKAPLRDPMGKTPRISYVQRKKPVLTIHGAIASTAKNRERTNKRLDELREAEGLPKRKTSYRMHGSMEVLVKPDSCTISDVKQERGFVYFNLNGGDSWAYYHPEDRPDYIYNFKGEPVYLTKELLPEYWEQLTQKATRTASTGEVYLAFLDRLTSTYYRGVYDPATDQLDLTQAKNETQVRHFGLQYGLPIGDYIPEWTLVFDPHSAVRVDVQQKLANTFRPTEYMRAKRSTQKTVPPIIERVIYHAVGSDDETYHHFMNWLAFIAQRLDRTGTAWVLHGTEGTGKGLLMNKIIRPLFGERQTSVRRVEELAERYNSYIKGALFVFIDEVQTSSLQNEVGVMAKLRNFITEPFISVREMHAVGIELQNYSNWIFNSNAADPVAIPRGDRRFNVGRYQPAKLEISERDIDGIEAELQTFWNYLQTLKVDEVKARTPLDTPDREAMIAITESAADTTAAALQTGSFEFFLDQLPSSDAYKLNALEMNKVESYTRTLKDWLARTERNTGKCNVSRDELRTVFEYAVGNVPNTPNKFTSYLKHRRLHVQKVWIDTGSVNGVPIIWRDISQWTTYEDRLNPQPKPVPKPKLKAVRSSR